MAHVIAFAGVPLGRAEAQIVLRQVGIPWNMIPADLRGASEGAPLRAGGPIRMGERIELVGFERAPGAPAWFARIRRLDADPPGLQVLIPAGAAVKLGITSKSVIKRLESQTDPAKLADEIKRLEVQAGLNSARHREEVVDNIAAWVRTNPAVSALGLWLPTSLALMEEVWPGAVAQIGEDITDGLCGAPLTSIPAWLLGACKPSQTPTWVPWVVGAAILIVVGVAVTSVRSLIPGGK